jgi:diguanylate cyclase (GGDEF)-like protein
MQHGTRMSTAMLVIGVLLGAVAVVVPQAAVGLYTGAIVVFATCAGWVYRRGALNRRFLVSVSTSGALYLLASLYDQIDSDPLITDLLEFAGAILIAFGLTCVIRFRPQRNDIMSEAIVGDGAIIALGSWLVSWIAVVQPMLERREGTGISLVAGLYIPLECVLVFIVAVALFRSPVRHVSLGLLCLAASLTLVGDAANGLFLGGALGRIGQELSWGAYVTAYFSAAAGFLHPSIDSLDAIWEQPRRKPMGGRLMFTAASLITPILLLAVVPPNGTADRVVRVVSATALAVASAVRVVTAVRSNAALQAAMLRNAHTDVLTGLPNRSLLINDINELVHNSWRTKQVPTVFFIDLDRFKNINDSLGHAAGDELLRQVAQRMKHAAPAGATVGRLSGDEYVVVDAEPESPARALATAESLLSAFREPFNLVDGDVFITASIGVASAAPTGSSSADDLLRHADTAMYRAKDAGRNCAAIYDESMHERVSQRLALETALYRALDRRELALFHQPILDLESSEVVGFEALMRWQQADGTLVSPAEFIPIAEETGTIVGIGAWAMLEALTQLRTWIDSGVCAPGATMSVNVAPRQLTDPSFPGIVSEARTRADVSPHQLWIEVTESTMISEPEVALATLRKLRAIGVRVALDDFGTGYSSLSLLQRFPLQRLKIDRAFVQGVADNSNDRSLVRTIVAMGRALGLDLVAEGVESIRQLQALHDLGCMKAQGYLISHPIPSDAMRSTVSALERLGTFPGLQPRPSEPFIR